MGNLIFWYFVVAVASNMIVSTVVLRLLFVKCKAAGLNYNETYAKYFMNGEKVLPILPPDLPVLIAIPFAFFMIQLLFPFNIKCLIVNYRTAIRDENI